MDFGMAWQAQVRLDHNAAGTVEGRAGTFRQHLAQPRRPDAAAHNTVRAAMRCFPVRRNSR